MRFLRPPFRIPLLAFHPRVFLHSRIPQLSRDHFNQELSKILDTSM
eukprot:SAG11_NODE_28278_length_323_cov_1.169643_1_plen_45_part_10